ncbi:MAG: cytochrome c oxidase subunit 3 [Verrucomicrobiota bacterium]
MDIPYTVSARPDTGLYNGKLGIWIFLASEVMLFGAIFTAYLFVRLGADDGSWPNHVQNVWLGGLNTLLLLASSITMVLAWVGLKERKFTTYWWALFATFVLGVAFLCIKGVEYYSKYEHYGFFIKEDAFGKYQADLDKEHDFYSYIPAQQVYEVRGHWLNQKDKNGPYTVLPDKAPGYINSGSHSGPVFNTASPEEAPTISIAASDLDPLRGWGDMKGYGDLLPGYGTYYAIYFLVTGLHALHIIGGTIVMLYFLTIGSRLYRRNPEQLSNRIEVTGIFWHFVDLVWITVFPILYLT